MGLALAAELVHKACLQSEQTHCEACDLQGTRVEALRALHWHRPSRRHLRRRRPSVPHASSCGHLKGAMRESHYWADMTGHGSGRAGRQAARPMRSPAMTGCSCLHAACEPKQRAVEKLPTCTAANVTDASRAYTAHLLESNAIQHCICNTIAKCHSVPRQRMLADFCHGSVNDLHQRFMRRMLMTVSKL